MYSLIHGNLKIQPTRCNTVYHSNTYTTVEEKFTFILFHSFTFCVFVIMYFDEQAGAQEEKRKIKKDKYLVRV